ncbi:MAG: lytic transglycosylase [Flavobacteriales bacterium CG_4_9_14_3_um_filter_40_17]|nr:MAG: lytic transglycosylase [Flavobacteriales bacterium CG_4_9_14_3_um_filter_40_17]
MKIVLLLVLLLMLNALAYSQQKTLPETSTENTIPADSIALIDNLASGLISEDSISSPFFIKKTDSSTNKVKFILKDLPLAAYYDSLTLRKFYGTGLYDSLQTIVGFKDVDLNFPIDLPTDTLKARLARLDAKTPFHVVYNPILEQVIHTFLKKRRKSLQRLMNLSEYYFPLFEKELDAQNVPLEIKYLAIIESALNPLARSRVGATGLWQFMFQTGKLYGLELNSYVDDRSDPVKSTVAATRYLSDMYQVFGDWDLVLAAYNSGPGNVNKAIRRSGGYQNYWNLRLYLPRETQGYLPAFLATMYIFEYAEQHGFERGREQIKLFETDTIHVKQNLPLKKVSEILGISEDDLAFLNPSYKIKTIPYIKGKSYTLRLPKMHAGLFVNNETDIYAYLKEESEKTEKPLPEFTELSSSTVYRVRSGDNLGAIANRHGTTVNHLKRWNGLKSNMLRVGQRLTIYTNNPGVKTVKTENSTRTDNIKTAEISDEMHYIVRSGDSLWSISQKFPGISVEDIKKWNDIRGNKLKPGMKLKLKS